MGEPVGLVFIGDEGGPIDPFWLTTEFRTLVRSALVPVIRLHDYDPRHCHASLLLFAGVPIKVVGKRLGHTTIAMTMDVYGHVMPAMDAEAATRLDDLIHGRSPGGRGRDLPCTRAHPSRGAMTPS